MTSPKTPKMTTELLRSYCEDALRNADELIVEASLLHEHQHLARAYFLSIACIEETGKALLGFDAQARNLSDPAICTKLKAGMENHAIKINYALGSWASSDPEPRKALKVAIDLILDLKSGREPSMYSDLRTDPNRAQTPSEVVRASAAKDCVRLAKRCLAYAHHHVNNSTPYQFTSAQDKLFTMKSSNFQKMLNLEDFWRYYISRMEVGQKDFAMAVIGYERDHYKAGTMFCSAKE